MTDALPPLTDDELTHIEDVARAATPGDWQLYNECGLWGICTNDKYVTIDPNKQDGRHIATADPQTVLRLIAEVRRLRAALGFYADEMNWDEEFCYERGGHAREALAGQPWP